jgi:hypothetical protein
MRVPGSCVSAELLADTKFRAVGRGTNQGKEKPRRDYAQDGFLVGLDGEGVFEFFHPRFQVFNLSLLLSQQQVFYPVKPCLPWYATRPLLPLWRWF